MQEKAKQHSQLAKTSLLGILLSIFILPILAIFIVEFFIDPFPNSLWLLRILNTNYLVHVRADLTVDGEPLVMERTFRCFNPVDYHWYPGTAPRGNVNASNGQTGDTLVATTAKGRLFAINAPDACSALGSRLKPDGEFYTWTNPANHDVTPLRLSLNEIETPVLYEIIGGRHPKQIDAYIARDALRRGYHDIQLNDLLIEKLNDRGLFKDWNGYEWFSKTYWVRHGRVSPFGRSVTRYAFVIPEERWDEVKNELLQNNPQDTLPKLLDEYRLLNSDSAIAGHNPFADFYNIGRQSWVFGGGYVQTELGLPKRSEQNNRKRYQWFLESIFPCIPTDAGAMHFVCDPSRNGIITSASSVFNSERPWIEYVTIGDIQFDAPRANGYFVATSPRRAYGFSQ